jgi:hypothetical protein
MRPLSLHSAAFANFDCMATTQNVSAAFTALQVTTFRAFW